MTASALAVWSVTCATSAAAETRPRVTSFQAPSGCTSQALFVGEVARRTRPSATEDTEALSFAVHVERLAPERHRGSVVVERGSGGGSKRVVEGASCEEVMHALALVVALTLDPEGGGTERPDEPPAVEGPPASTPLAPAPAAEQPARPRTPSQGSSESEVTLGIGAHAAAHQGVAPDTIFTVPVFVELGVRRESTPSLRARFAPAIRLGFVRGSGERAFSGVGRASFTWTAGEVDLCPLAAEVARFSLVPCARMELGALTGEGAQIAPARSQTALWAALALPVRLRAALTRWLFVEAEAAPRLPLQRERFVFQPDFTVFRAPSVAWTAGAGAGVTFP